MAGFAQSLRSFAHPWGGGLKAVKASQLSLLWAFPVPVFTKASFRRREPKKPGAMHQALTALSGKRDSDPRPQPWQGCALPTELFPQNFLWKILRYSWLRFGNKSIYSAHLAQEFRNLLKNFSRNGTANISRFFVSAKKNLSKSAKPALGAQTPIRDRCRKCGPCRGCLPGGRFRAGKYGRYSR